MSINDVWKRRAWAAAAAMKVAEQCRTIEDARRVLSHARLEIEAAVVYDQNKRDIAVQERLKSEGVDDDDTEGS